MRHITLTHHSLTDSAYRAHPPTAPHHTHPPTAPHPHTHRTRRTHSYNVNANLETDDGSSRYLMYKNYFVYATSATDFAMNAHWNFEVDNVHAYAESIMNGWEPGYPGPAANNCYVCRNPPPPPFSLSPLTCTLPHSHHIICAARSSMRMRPCASVVHFRACAWICLCA
jgi:hypothetical protein